MKINQKYKKINRIKRTKKSKKAFASYLSKFVTVVALVFIPSISNALVINEIAYDIEGTDGGREWIEVFNESSESVALSDWKLLENKVKHSISYVDGTEILKSGEYAVIADNTELFLVDNPDYLGPLFESVFSLSNSGEELSLVNNLEEIVDTAVYSGDLGGKGNGLSLQLLEGIFISAKFTPGEQNAIEPYESEDTNNNTTNISDISSSSNTSTHEEQMSLSSGEMTKVITVHAGRDRLATVFTPLKFEGLTRSLGNSSRVKFLWNFGDGSTGNGKNVEHVYKHPGTYNVVLNAISKSDKAISRTKVNVFYPTISLENKENGVFIRNDSEYEVNIGKFELDFGRYEFEFPKDTIISKNSEILFDWSTLGTGYSSSTLGLYFPSGKLIATSTKSDLFL